MSDTPRTDKEVFPVETKYGDGGSELFIDPDFARTLERELNEARAEATRLRALLEETCKYAERWIGRAEDAEDDAARYRHLCATHPGCLCFDGEEYADKAALYNAIDTAMKGGS